MKVLTVTHKYPPSIGGMQKQSFELINGLTKKTVVSPLIFDNSYPKFLFLFLVIPRIIIRCLKDPSINIIHANDGLMALVISPIMLFTKRKLAVTIHGLDVVFPFYLYQLWVRKVLSKFDLIITVSNETRNECILRGVPAEKVFFVPNGFDSVKKISQSKWNSEELGIPKNKKILLAVGRLIKRKGFSWFALNVMPLTDKNALFVIVGPREKHLKMIRILDKILPYKFFNLICLFIGLSLDEYEIDQAMDKEILKDKVLFLGKLPQDQLDELRSNADIYVMPNIRVKGDYEGFGLVALESVSAGTLCIAADVDGIPSAIQDNFNGIILPAQAAEVWAKQINDLLANPSKLIELTERFNKNLIASATNWDHMCERYIQLFKQIS